jgi:SOS response regulatory protein OraA/RecX
LQGVDRDIIEHALETDEKIALKKLKLRKMSEEKVKQLKLKCKGCKMQK